MENDTWFRKKSSETRGGLVLIGQQTEDLTQHLKWWMPTDWSAKFSIENYESLADWDSWRVVGTKGTNYPESESAARPLENSRSNDPPYALLRHLFDSDNHLSDESHYDSFERNSTFIAIQSHESLERLYAQHIFYAFVWEAVKKTDGAFRYHPEFDSSSTPLDTRDWNTLRLQCIELSKLARAIQTTDLMDLHSAYHALIPPLHSYDRFGELDCAIEMMSGKAKKQERLLNWAAAAKCYEQLFLLSVNFGVDSYIYNKSVALMVEYIRAIYDLLQTVLPKDKEMTVFSAANEAADSLSSLLEQKAGFQVLNALRNLYSLQSKKRRVWSNSKAFPRAQQHSPVNYKEIKHCNLTKLHRWIAGSLKSFEARGVWTSEQRSYSSLSCLPRSLRQYVNTPDILGWTPLHYAVSTHTVRSIYWVQLLLKQDADVNFNNIREYTSLHYHLMYNGCWTMALLLEGGVNVKAVGVDAITSLHVAASSRVSLSLKRLLFDPRQPADQFAVDNLGRAPIHLAALIGSSFTIEQLRLSIGARDKEGRTALHLAASSGHWHTVAELVRFGTSLDEPSGPGETVLYRAVNEMDYRAVDKLLHLGATVNLRDSMPETLLHIACSQDHKGIARLLIQNGANVNEKNYAHETPIMIATTEGSVKVVDLLLKSPNLELEHLNGYLNYSNCTALGIVVEEGNSCIVRKLVEKGATIDSQTLRLAKKSKDDLSSARLIREFYALENCVRDNIRREGADLVWGLLRRALLERDQEYVPWALFARTTGTSFCFL